ncbi:hypothetical protein L6164_032430 [Bauhinia variegata]|uniref:Uncharacterized protein n=1 Tax=Bauhinia variegata TaxID=167791 RepID=A0ACB9KNQ4_BAUVA|nr:hypothetical protein L6164_032430 [Bauhinia variegata]
MRHTPSLSHPLTLKFSILGTALFTKYHSSFRIWIEGNPNNARASLIFPCFKHPAIILCRKPKAFHQTTGKLHQFHTSFNISIGTKSPSNLDADQKQNQC